MPTDKNTDPTTPITLTQAAAVVPALRGKRLHVSTLWRWCRRGCKGRNGLTIRLAHGRVGGQITTTRAALDRFYAELAEADLQSFRKDDPPAEVELKPLPPKGTTGTRQAAIDRAKKALDDAGI